MNLEQVKKLFDKYYDISNVVKTSNELAFTISANGEYVADVTTTGHEIQIADSETGGVQYFELDSITERDIRNIR